MVFQAIAESVSDYLRWCLPMGNGKEFYECVITVEQDVSGVD